MSSYARRLSNGLKVRAGETILPLSFGTTFPDRESLVAEFLEPRHDELAGLLKALEGRVELLVKAYYREEAILAEVVRNEPRIARLRAVTRERPAAASGRPQTQAAT